MAPGSTARRAGIGLATCASGCRCSSASVPASRPHRQDRTLWVAQIVHAAAARRPGRRAHRRGAPDGRHHRRRRAGGAAQRARVLRAGAGPAGGRASTATRAQRWRRCAQQPPQLLFLDIQMDSMTGMELARSLDPLTLPLIVFVTAYDHYALEAFEVSAVDYLLKPFDDARFQAHARAGARGATRRPAGFDRRRHACDSCSSSWSAARGRARRPSRASSPRPAAACTCSTWRRWNWSRPTATTCTWCRPRELPRAQHLAAGGEVPPGPADAAHQPLVPGQHAITCGK